MTEHDPTTHGHPYRGRVTARRRLALCGQLWAAAATVMVFSSSGFCAEPAADDPKIMSGQQILDALHPPATRAFKSRGLSRMPAGDPQAPVAAQSSAGQSVNLNIPFESNSSTLQPQATMQLKALGFALSSSSLAKDRFLVAGHTDAKGSAQYNKQLSQKRADAVKRFLVANGMDAARLDTVGYGSEKPLLPDNPGDPGNRRVEIRDLGESPP